ncbi:MAG: electron transfer flavoprotein subunit beta/FixA family protein [Aeropyrum sp.]|nr:electron transfer flavoprotein subunit beta/FixA family protein [Aeropyrum sp.]MCE4616901.1 electron transfer flavoprotein subunit beta/FixA family protein [Aeropyrum sp.]
MGLRIVVGFKWVPNTQAVRIDPKTGTLIRQGVPSIINPPDLAAVELALRLRDRYGGEVIAATMGPPPAVKGLEHLISMGVDYGYMFSDRVFAGADTLATSYVLANGLKLIEGERGKVDLAIFGQETIDSSTAHIGAQVASWLEWPYVYYVRWAELTENSSIRVERIVEGYLEEYEVPLPAVLSVAMRAFKPRDITLKGKLRAKLEKPFKIVSNKDLGLDPRCVGLKGSPTIVAKVTYLPDIPRKREVYKPRDPRDGARWLLRKLLKDPETRDLILRQLWGG